MKYTEKSIKLVKEGDRVLHIYPDGASERIVTEIKSKDGVLSVFTRLAYTSTPSVRTFACKEGEEEKVLVRDPSQYLKVNKEDLQDGDYLLSADWLDKPDSVLFVVPDDGFYLARNNGTFVSFSDIPDCLITVEREIR